MCGIAGRFHAFSLPPDPLWHERADRLLAHRGPDGSGHYVDNYCELVHRRLALIDLSPTGDQPMANEDGSVLVIYNGEIYNHPELRRRLEQQGHCFRGTSDTEVLVHLYEERGPEMLSELRGMFAFALYDRTRRSLLLARDRFGIKPLFYAQVNDRLVFASEIKAILAAEGIVPRIDRQACYDFLGLGYVPEPATGFEGVCAVPKGTALVFDPAGRRAVQFAEVRARPRLERGLEEAVDSIEEVLSRAVKRQSVADVQVAALLSGGIDSSLVVAAFCRTSPDAPVTFNVRFPDKGYDETPVALAVAQRCRTRHHTVDVGESALTPDLLLDLVRHFDQPFADSSLIPTYWVSRAISDNGVKCALSGDGGDEAFGGYAPFWRANRLVRFMTLPTWAQRLLYGTGKALTPLTRNLGRRLYKASELAGTGSLDSSVLLAALSNYLTDDEKRDLVLPEARTHLQDSYRLYGHHQPEGTTDFEELSLRLTDNFFELGLPSDMLRKVDMMSMRASIEVRVPMLDEEVVEAGLALSHALKTDGSQGKLVLRRLARRWLPTEVAEHPKRGFSIPLDSVASPAFHALLEELLLSGAARTRTFLKPRRVEEWLGLFRQASRGTHSGTVSRGNLYQRVFSLMVLELWLREHNLSW